MAPVALSRSGWRHSLSGPMWKRFHTRASYHYPVRLSSVIRSGHADFDYRGDQAAGDWPARTSRITRGMKGTIQQRYCMKSTLLKSTNAAMASRQAVNSPTLRL